MKNLTKILMTLCIIAMLSCVLVACDEPGDQTLEPVIKHAVVFDTNYDGPYEQFGVEDKEKVERPSDPTREGYIFLGWYRAADGDVKFDFDIIMTRDLTIYAHWKKVNEVIFDTDEGSTIDSVVIENDKKVTKPSDPTKEGFKFLGWFTTADGDTLFDFDSAITADTTIYAQWVEANEVIFNTDNGSDNESVLVENDSKVTKPSDPTKEGFMFLGWYTTADGDTLFDFDSAITVDTTIYAQWVEANEVIFNTDNGSDNESVLVESDSKVTRPSTDPVKVGGVFKGWYTTADGNTLFDFDSAITADTTIYAQWFDIGGNYYYEVDGMPMLSIVITEDTFTLNEQVFEYTTTINGDLLNITVNSNGYEESFVFSNDTLVNANNPEREYQKVNENQCIVKVILSANNSGIFVMDKNQPIDSNLYAMFSSMGTLYNGKNIITATTLITSDMEIIIKVQNHADAPYLGKYIQGESFSDGLVDVGEDIIILSENAMSLGNEDEMPYNSKLENGVYIIALMDGSYLQYDPSLEEMTRNSTIEGELFTAKYTLIPENVKVVTIYSAGYYGETQTYYVTSGNKLDFTPANSSPYRLEDENCQVFDPTTEIITEDIILNFVAIEVFSSEDVWAYSDGTTTIEYIFFSSNSGMLSMYDNEGGMQEVNYFSYTLAENSENSSNYDVTITYNLEEVEIIISLTFMGEENKIIDSDNKEYTIKVNESADFSECCGVYEVVGANKVIAINDETVIVDGIDYAIIDKNFNDDTWLITIDKTLKGGDFEQISVYPDGTLFALNNSYTKQV